MRSLSAKLLLSLTLFSLPTAVYAHSVTLSGTSSFAALDGSAEDHDHLVNGVFTVTDGDLIVNGVVNCNDDSGSDSACSMAFRASGDIVVNAGGALYSENRSGGGTGGSITLTAGRDLTLRGASTTLAAALVSTASKSSSGSLGGNVTANVARNVTLEQGSTIDAGSANARAGSILIAAGGAAVIDGNVFSGPSRTLLSTRLNDGAALSGGSSNSGGGEIRISSTTFLEPAVTIGGNASIVSQGDQTATGPVTIEGCGIVVKGLVAALSRKDTAARVHIRSGKDILLDARDLGVAGATLGRNARVRADAPTGTAINKGIDLFAAETISIFGPAASSSSFYPLTSLAGVHDAKSFGGTIRIISTGEGVIASGNVIDDGRSSSGDTGGAIEISAKANVNLHTGVIRSFGDSSTGNPARGGGSVRVRSYAGNVIWTSGLGDVRPTGSTSGLPAADQGKIALTACGTIDISGSSFPTNGAPVGTFPGMTTGACAIAAPPLPAGTPSLVTCNTPPVANDATASTHEDNSVTISLSGTDVDGDSLTFSVVSGPSHGTVGSVVSTGPNTATVVYTPAANYNGADSFVFVANDGNGGTDDATATIAIAPVNDAPGFLAGPTVSSLEDAGAQTYPNWATSINAGPADETGQSVTFTVTNNNNALFSTQPAVAADGTLTYTAAPNAYGSATITVTAHDNGGTANGGVATSASQNVSLTINGVNDAPSFTRGPDVTVAEDAAAYSAPWATAITAGTNEGSQALTFVATSSNSALFSVQPAISASGVLTFTVAADANGSATINVVLKDDGGTANGGVDTTAAQSFTISVNAVNDNPSFTAGGDVTVLEDSGAYSAAWATGIAAGPSDESAQSVSFSVTTGNAALFSSQPAIAANGQLSFATAANAYGTATVTVTLSDNAGGTSAAQTFTIVLTEVNDAPSFTSGGNVTVAEDAASYSAPWATGISSGPNETQSVTFAVTNDNNSLFSTQPSISSTGALLFALTPDANGSATLTVTLSDDGGTSNGGADSSASQTFTITVTAVNDNPSFTSGGDVTVLEDSGAYSAAWATGISAGPSDESAQTLSFNATNDNNSLFSVQPAISASGLLTFTAAANANGSATVTVTLSDDAGGASVAQTFTITIGAINDAPSFTAGGNVTVNEDSAAYSAQWASAISAGASEGSQTVSFSVTNDNNALFAVQPSISASGVLSFTLLQNANGSATVTVVLSDDGGTANGGADTSASQTFTLTINAVNDAPSFVKGADQLLSEDAGAQTVAGWATSIEAGPADEAGQTVSFSVTASNPALFSIQPAVSANGTLTYTIAQNAFGSSNVTVVLSDAGGASSAAQSFTITVNEINDPPTFTAGGNVTVNEDSGLYSAQWATAISAGDGESQPLTFTVTNDNNALFAIQPSISAAGVLSFTLTPNTHGTANVTVTLSDGSLSTAPVTFVITVNDVNDLPVVNNESYETIGNTLLQVANAKSVTGPAVFVSGNLLSNDVDGDGGPSALSTTLVGATPGANVTVNSDGSFTYLPAAGFTGNDTFVYAVSDGAGTATGTVTISVTQRVWYVDNNGGAGNGRSHAPFSTLAQAENASTIGDVVYVFSGNGTTAGQNGGFTIKDSQRLIGAGVALSMPVALNGGANPTILAGPAAAPLVGSASGNGVTIGSVSNVEVAGLNITGSTNGIAVIASTLGGNIHDNTVRALATNALRVASPGVVTLTISSNVLTSPATALQVTGASIASRVAIDGNSTSSTTGNGIDLDLVTVTSFSGNSVSGNNGGIGIRALNVVFDAIPGGLFNTVAGGATNVGAAGNGVGGAGVVIALSKGALAFGALNVFADGGTALHTAAVNAYTGTDGLLVSSTGGMLSGNGGPAIFGEQVTLGLTLASASSTSSSTKGLSFSNAHGNVVIAGGAIVNAVGGGVDVTGSTLNLTYGGTIASTNLQKTVSVTGHSAGTLMFSGAITGTGVNSGIVLSGNAATTTVNFTGGINLNTASGKALSAVNAGTLNVGGSSNVLVTTNATALEINGTTIGGAGATFRSISSNGAVSGIVLANTGTLGGLSVTGTGAAGSGGVIAASSGPGVSLVNTNNVSLAAMNIQNGGDDGINATGVNGFSLSNVNATGNGNSATDQGLQLDNVTGAISIANTTVSGSAHNNAWLRNTAGTVSSLTVSSSTFSNSSSAYGNSGFLVDLNGTAALTAAAISNSTFNGNRTVGLQVTAGTSATIGSLDVTGATVTGNNVGIDVNKAQNASVTFRLAGSTVTRSNSHGVNVFAAAGVTSGVMKVRLEANTIGDAAVTGSGSAIGNGIRVNVNGNTAMQLLVDGNNVRQTPNGRGIEIIARNGTGGADATVTNNNVNPNDTSGFPLAAIYLQSNAASIANRLRADVRNNVVPAGASMDLLPAYLIFVESNGSTAELVDSAPPSATAAAQLASSNTGSTDAAAGVALIAGPINVP